VRVRSGPFVLNVDEKQVSQGRVMEIGQGGVEQVPDVEKIRARIQKMTDSELAEYGRSAKYMTSAKANLGKPPRETFVVQLREALEEWNKRHPK
jgi:hypothetical protein